MNVSLGFIITFVLPPLRVSISAPLPSITVGNPESLLTIICRGLVGRNPVITGRSWLKPPVILLCVLKSTVSFEGMVRWNCIWFAAAATSLIFRVVGLSVPCVS